MSAKEYPKIDTLYERDENFKVDTTKLRRPEFAIPREWVVTEKIDGTNCRVSLEFAECEDCYREDCEKHKNEMGDWVVRFYGRTERAQMPTFLLEYLQNMFPLDKMQSLWRGPGEAEYPITLYGEGYGARIQKGGGNYRRDGDVSFRLFDVLIGETWLGRANVEDVGRQLGVKPVPLLGRDYETNVLVDVIKNNTLESSVAATEGTPGAIAEGIVAFTDPPLFNGQGKRLMWKLKTRDFTTGR